MDSRSRSRHMGPIRTAKRLVSDGVGGEQSAPALLIERTSKSAPADEDSPKPESERQHVDRMSVTCRDRRMKPCGLAVGLPASLAVGRLLQNNVVRPDARDLVTRPPGAPTTGPASGGSAVGADRVKRPIPASQPSKSRTCSGPCLRPVTEWIASSSAPAT
jgi:hypothetical protein